ncbi:MAG: hypothetical protein ACRC0Y_11120 [Fusobacteriaceae bacterium]
MDWEKFNEEVYLKNFDYYYNLNLCDEYHDFLIKNNFDTSKKLNINIAKLKKSQKRNGTKNGKNNIHLSTIFIDGEEIDIFATIKSKEECKLDKINFTDEEIKVINYLINTKNKDNKLDIPFRKRKKIEKDILKKLEDY